MQKIKFAAIISFFTLLGLFQRIPAYALESNKFDLKTETVYQLLSADSDTTKVTINYSLTNLSSAFFASQYVIELGDPDIKNLKAFDATDTLPIQPKLNGDKNQAIVTFKSPVAGIGKVQKWTVSYESTKFIKKNGSLYQIMLPPPFTDDYTTDYSIVLKIPTARAKPVSFNPQPSKTQEGSFTWTKADLKNSGVYSVFSTQNPAVPFVAYNFKISYQVTNPKLVPVNIEVPFPPDTAYQKILLKEASPRPLDVRVDSDGNWLAKYYLGSNGKLEISVIGTVALFQKPSVTVFAPKPDLKKLTSADQFWEVDNTGIKSEAGKYQSVREIYDGVLSNLKNRPIEKSPDARRSGAQYVLLVGDSSTGQDYTDLFVTLSRARHVPTREIIGIIPSAGSLTPQLQSWAQYFESETNSWRMVDPSLEAITKGLNYFSDWDLNHFALITRGQSSVKPFFPNFSTKDSFNISLTPSDSEVDIFSQAKINIHPDIPAQATAGFPVTGKLFVENDGPTIHDALTLRLSSTQFEILSPILETDILPPFSSKVLDTKIKSPNWLSSTNGTISLEAAGVARNFKITVEPIYKAGFIQILGVLIMLAVISIGTQIGRAVTKKSHDHSRSI